MRFARALALAGSLAALPLAACCAHGRSAPQPEEAVEVQGRIVTDPAPEGDCAGKPCERAAEPHDAGEAPGCRCRGSDQPGE